jgi:hypothetical protein
MEKISEEERLKKMVAGGLADKATLFGLLVTEFMKEYGDDALKIAKKAASKRGQALGKRIRKYMEEKGRDKNDLLQVRVSFAETSGSTASRKDLITEKNKLEYEITYCPWVAAWKEAGFSAQETAMFCDVMSESDNAFPQQINPKIQVKNDQGLGKGKTTCKVCWELK